MALKPISLPDFGPFRNLSEYHCSKQNLDSSEKKLRLAIRAPRLVVDHTTEGAPAYDAAPRETAAMVSELRGHAAANVVKLFVQTLVLQMTPFLDSGLMMWLYDPLRP